MWPTPRVGIIKGASAALMYVSSKLILFVTLLSHSLLFGGHLDARTLFMSMALLNNVQFTMTQLMPRVVSLGVESLVSLRRIGDFLLGAELAPAAPLAHVGPSAPAERPALAVVGLSARWPGAETRTLANISFECRAGQLLAICGPVAAGKSSLLLALLGELPAEGPPDGTRPLQLQGSLAYCSQSAWLFAGTLRDNILLGRPMEPARYRRVLDACALGPDLEQLAHGDLTYIQSGALSGGQRARLNLARCLYGDRDIYLLDDPLSALDGRVAARVLERAIRGLLAGKLVLLATHQLSLLKPTDRLLVLDHGEQLACADLADLGPHLANNQRLSYLRGQFADNSIMGEPTNAGPPPAEQPPSPVHLAGPQSEEGGERRVGLQSMASGEQESHCEPDGQLQIGDKLLIGPKNSLVQQNCKQIASAQLASEPRSQPIDCKVHGDGACRGHHDAQSPYRSISDPQPTIGSRDMKSEIKFKKTGHEKPSGGQASWGSDGIADGARKRAPGTAKIWYKYYTEAATWRLVLLVASFLATQATFSSIDVYLTVWSLAEQNRVLLSQITGQNQELSLAVQQARGHASLQTIGYDSMPDNLMQLMSANGSGEPNPSDSSLTTRDGKVFWPLAADEMSQLYRAGVSPLSWRSSAGSMLALPSGGLFVPLEDYFEFVDSRQRLGGGGGEILGSVKPWSGQQQVSSHPTAAITTTTTTTTTTEPLAISWPPDTQSGGQNSSSYPNIPPLTNRRLLIEIEKEAGSKNLAKGQKVKHKQQVESQTIAQQTDNRQNNYNNNFNFNFNNNNNNNNYNYNNDKPDEEGNTRRDDDKTSIGHPVKATMVMADEDILLQSNQALNVNSIYRPLYLFVNNFTSKDHALTYTILLIALSLLSATTNILFFTSSNKSAISLYKKLTDNALFAKVSFFDSHPIGGLLNRGSRDIGIIDESIPYNASQAYDAILKTLATFVMVTAVNFDLLIPSLIMLLLFAAYHSINIHATKDIQRLEGSLRSPIISHLGSSIAGLHTIRASQSEAQFEGLFMGHQDAHTSAFLLYIGLNRATAVYLDCLNALYTACLAAWAVMSGLSGPSAGLVITSAMLLAGLTQHGVMKLTETESLMTSVERVIEYCALPQEDDYHSGRGGALSSSDAKRSSPPVRMLRNNLIKQTARQLHGTRASPPTGGQNNSDDGGDNGDDDDTNTDPRQASSCISVANNHLNDYKASCLLPIARSLQSKSVLLEFRHVDFYYDRQHKPVLRNISFKLDSGEKVAIVGRTGAGKSSIISTLFRLYHFEGSVLLDGHDTKGLDLFHLRTSIGIIPQSPVLFSTTIRANLDPFHVYDDFALWLALDKAHLRETVSALPGKLDFNIGGRIGGAARESSSGISGSVRAAHEPCFSFSSGQKQLMCLARVLLRQNRLIVMDEATADVDPATDAIIQSTIRREFKHCTLITIAHRLETIMDYDRIMVLEAGRIVDFDTPERLMAKKGSYFADMVHKSGSPSKMGVPSLKANHN